MIDLHGEVVSHLLQDIPFIIELMELIKEKAKELTEEETEYIQFDSNHEYSSLVFVFTNERTYHYGHIEGVVLVE